MSEIENQGKSDNSNVADVSKIPRSECVSIDVEPLELTGRPILILCLFLKKVERTGRSDSLPVLKTGTYTIPLFKTGRGLRLT